MKKKEIGRLLFKEIEKIHQHKEWDKQAQVDALYGLMGRAFVEATKEERVLFTTLFSRISYACQRYEVKKQRVFFIHNFRIEAQRLWRGKKLTEKEIEKELYPLGLQAVSDTIAALFDSPIPKEILNILPPKGFYKSRPADIKSFKPSVRVLILGEDEEKHQLIAQA